MHLQSTNTPSSAPGGHTWENEDSVVEVPDELGTELLRIAGQFSEVLPGAANHPGTQAGDSEDESDVLGTAEEDLIGPEPEKKGNSCAQGGCGNTAKRGLDYCRWHQPTTPIAE